MNHLEDYLGGRVPLPDASIISWSSGTMLVMGVFFDYFAAGSDQEAAGVIDRLGGPSSQSVVVPQPAPSKRLFRRHPAPLPPQFDTDSSLTVFDTVTDTGVDPLVQLGSLQSILKGRDFDTTLDEILSVPEGSMNVAIRDGGERLVMAVPDSTVSALAESTDEQLAQAAGPWSETEEFWGQGDPEILTGLIMDLAGLARRAQSNGNKVYCWVCV